MTHQNFDVRVAVVGLSAAAGVAQVEAQRAAVRGALIAQEAGRQTPVHRLDTGHTGHTGQN